MFTKLEVISVDDEIINNSLIEEYSNKLNMNVKSFTSSIEASEYVKENNIDLAFVDYYMPNMNGIELIKNIRKYHPDSPIVMITGMSEAHEFKVDAIKAGATEFLTKPLDPIEFEARVLNLGQLRFAQLQLKNRALHLQEEIRKATVEIEEREQQTLVIMGKAAEYKDPETANHILRVSHYSKLLAKAYGLSEEEQELIYKSAPLHDVGKMGIPDAILLKKGKLTDDEYEKIKTHTEIGYQIINKTNNKYLKAGAQIAISHHEKYDGTGYPKNIKGEEIPLFGRIVAVCDVFDALTTKRPYKDPWPLDKAINLLESEKDKSFDSKLVNIFLENIEEVKEILNEFFEE